MQMVLYHWSASQPDSFLGERVSKHEFTAWPNKRGCLSKCMLLFRNFWGTDNPQIIGLSRWILSNVPDVVVAPPHLLLKGGYVLWWCAFQETCLAFIGKCILYKNFS